MSSLLGVLPFGSVLVPGRGPHVLEPGDLEVWAEGAAGTPVFSAIATGRRTLAGRVDRVRVDKGRAFVWGDLDPSLPGGPEARWGITKSAGTYDRLDARLLARPDPLRNLSDGERDLMRKHWGEWPTDDAGVIVQSLAVAAVGLTPGAAWLGA